MITVDALAQHIRYVDGRNALGAGALAEALMPFIEAALSAAPAPQWMTDELTRIRDEMHGNYPHYSQWLREFADRCLQHLLTASATAAAPMTVDEVEKIILETEPPTLSPQGGDDES